MALSPGFTKRLLSALLLGPIALGLLIAHPATFLVVVIPAFLLALYEWMGMARAVPSQRILTAVLGGFYITAAFLAFFSLGLPEMGGSWVIVLGLLLAVWASDTGGYVFGKAYGGPKWVPSISPNKTWAGLGGAMLLPGLFAPGWMLFYLPEMYAEIGPVLMARVFLIYFFFGLVIGFVCQVGDLFISIFKRRAGVKDTGTLIPGHGGILDRIDSLMAASLFVYIAMKVIN